MTKPALNKHSQELAGKDNALDGIDELFTNNTLDVMTDTTQKRQSRFTELSVLEAAQALGISERTLWRRIESQQYKSRIKNKKRVVRVPLADFPQYLQSDNADSGKPPGGHVGTVIDLAGVVDQLNAANYRIGYLQSQLENKEEQLKLLPDLEAQARNSGDELVSLKTQLAVLETKLSQYQRPWWKKLFHLPE